jgi:hypothetical protein
LRKHNASELSKQQALNLYGRNIYASGYAVTLGGFASNNVYTVGTGPEVLVVADINQDGLPDLIVANNGAGSVSVLTNNGAGCYVLSSTPSTSISGAAYLAVADFNGEGLSDFVVSSYGNNSMVVFTNGGAGVGYAFTKAQGISLASGPLGVRAGDFNLSAAAASPHQSKALASQIFASGKRPIRHENRASS